MSSAAPNDEPNGFGPHLRRTFLAGLFAVAPIAVTVYLIYLGETQTRIITEKLFGRYIPVLGAVLIIIGVYLAGLFVTNVIGKWFVGLLDKCLDRVPLLREAYRAWKQVSFATGGGEGMYAKVVLAPAQDGKQRVMAFTDGVPLPADDGEDYICVFVPNTPNPVVGQLRFVPAAQIIHVDISVEDAFKTLISTGNFLPPLTSGSADR
ncbi:MAG: DUF502 domain-containing protein [Planctomycetota bacterium]